MSATVHDTTDGSSKVALLTCESCTTRLRGFVARDEDTARVLAEREAIDAGWQITPGAPAKAAAWGQIAATPDKHHCPRHKPKRKR